MQDAGYVLVTPARNEEAYIENTLRAVISQTVLPKKWVIVNDGSTDSTADIVRRYLRDHRFVDLITVVGEAEANFSSKVRAFAAGFRRLAGLQYAYVGNLDADISFGANYYEKIMEAFRANSRLGIAGGIVLELIRGNYVAQRISPNSVAGAVQLFRRRCYEEVGGYIGLRGGGVDAAVEILARMRGWEVATLNGIGVLHHRRVLTGKAGIMRKRFQSGVTNYALGYHPLFQVVSCLYRFGERPYGVGSVLTLLGYCSSAVRRDKRVVPEEAVKYLRTEQVQRMWAVVSRRRIRADG